MSGRGGHPANAGKPTSSRPFQDARTPSGTTPNAGNKFRADGPANPRTTSEAKPETGSNFRAGDPDEAVQAPEETRRPPVWLTVLALLACVAIPVLKAYGDYAFLLQSPYRFSDTGRPMLVNADGYHFLRLARNVGQVRAPSSAGPAGQDGPASITHGYQARANADPPALSWVLARVSSILGLPLETVALWLSPALSLSLVPLAWAWGRRLGGDAAGPVAAFAAMTSPYWVEVTALGRCQTPCLVPALLLACALALDGLIADKPARRWTQLAVFAACAGLLAWWWRPGGYLCAAMLACSLVAPGRRLGRATPYVRGGVLALAAACAPLLVSGAWRSLPEPLGAFFYYADRHIGLALGTNPEQASMAASIIELAPLGPGELAGLVSGSWPAFLVGLAGLTLGLFRRPRAVWPLLPLLGTGLLALRSMRLTLFLFPLVAVGLGVLADKAARFGPLAKRTSLRCGITLVLAALVCLPAMRRDFGWNPEYVIDTRFDALVRDAAQSMPESAVLWSWWDYGYYLAWRTGRAPFFDGGSQTAEDAFVAAFPLVCPDANLAANWMRFFAAWGQGEFGRLAARAGSREKALDLLARLFSEREDPAPLMRALGGEELADPRGHFFPDVEVFLVLPWDLWRRNGHWMAYGSSPVPPQGTPPNRVDVFSARGLEVDARAERLVLPDEARAKGYASMRSVVDLAWRVPAPEMVDALSDPILFFHTPSNLAFIADRALARSLAFRLLAPTGFVHRRFETVSCLPGVGGVWRVPPPWPGR